MDTMLKLEELSCLNCPRFKKSHPNISQCNAIKRVSLLSGLNGIDAIFENEINIIHEIYKTLAQHCASRKITTKYIEKLKQSKHKHQEYSQNQLWDTLS